MLSRASAFLHGFERGSLQERRYNQSSSQIRQIVDFSQKICCKSLILNPCKCNSLNPGRSGARDSLLLRSHMQSCKPGDFRVPSLSCVRAQSMNASLLKVADLHSMHQNSVNFLFFLPWVLCFKELHVNPVDHTFKVTVSFCTVNTRAFLFSTYPIEVIALLSHCRVSPRENL